MDKEETRRLLMRELVDKHCSHILAERIGTGAMWIAAPEFGTAIDLVPGRHAMCPPIVLSRVGMESHRMPCFKTKHYITHSVSIPSMRR